ncbi:MAG: T9SS type A sorting domain-containing protein [candidate division Zixibacteria bacterium]|nr:T9SS type A sorting domain-containing protein [candidate division Zixibacteria bacterium]
MRISSLSNLLIMLMLFALGIAQSQTIDTSWTRTYGGNLHDYATSLLQTYDDGYLLAGITYSYGAGDKDLYLVKTNSSGDTLWTKVYGDTLIDNVFSIKPTYDSGYVIGGWSSSHSGTNEDFDCYIVKLDHDGELDWENYCTDSSNCGAYDIVQTDDGGYLMAGGGMSSNPFPNFDMFAVRADEFGDTIWTEHYVVPGRELWDGLAYSVTKTIDGCYVLAGEIKNRRENHSDIYVIKINDNGDTLWTKIIDYDRLEYIWDCLETPEGDIVLTGWTWGGFPDSTGDHIYLAKLARNGDFLWQKTYAYQWPAVSYNDAWAIAIDPADNGYLIAADTRPAVITQRDIYVLKTDFEGDLLWSSKIGSYVDESPFNIIITNDNGFAVCGQKFVENSLGYLYKDFYLLKYESLSDIPHLNNSTPDNIELAQNYPNPFNARTIIEYNLPISSEVAINIYDILGRRVGSLIEGKMPAGGHQILWDAEDVPSGMYFYTFQAGNNIKTRKMLLLK